MMKHALALLTLCLLSGLIVWEYQTWTQKSDTSTQIRNTVQDIRVNKGPEATRLVVRIAGPYMQAGGTPREYSRRAIRIAGALDTPLSAPTDTFLMVINDIAFQELEHGVGPHDVVMEVSQTYQMIVWDDSGIHEMSQPELDARMAELNEHITAFEEALEAARTWQPQRSRPWNLAREQRPLVPTPLRPRYCPTASLVRGVLCI